MVSPGLGVGGKVGRCVGLTTLPPSCDDCLEIWAPQPPKTLRACSRPSREKKGVVEKQQFLRIPEIGQIKFEKQIHSYNILETFTNVWNKCRVILVYVISLLTNWRTYIKFLIKTLKLLRHVSILKSSLTVCVRPVQDAHTQSSTLSKYTIHNTQHPVNATNWTSDCFKRDFSEESVAPWWWF